MSKGGGGGGGGGGHGRSGSRSLSSAATNRGLSSSAGFVSPTLMATSLRSVLSHMSEDELRRYKHAFQSADADEDGYLNLKQAMEALQSCGVSVSSGAMLDSLDDLEVAQEGALDASPWEAEQNRRRRRRRRASLEQMEGVSEPRAYGGHGTGLPAYKAEPQTSPQASHAAAAAASATDDECLGSPLPPPPLSRSNSIGRPSEPAANSSLKSPSIDISTFLNLARRDPAVPTLPPSTRAKLAAPSSSSLPHSQSAAVLSSAASRAAAPASPAAPPAQRSTEWEHSGFQASSNAGGPSGRPLAGVFSGEAPLVVGGGVTAEALNSHSSRAYPAMRLSDHDRRASLSIAHDAFPLTPAGAAVSFRRGGSTLITAADDLDDEPDEFDPESDLLAAFHTFDPNQTGQMSIKNLVAIMMAMGEMWPEEDALEMAEEVDPQHEGRFDYSKLVRKLVSRE